MLAITKLVNSVFCWMKKNFIPERPFSHSVFSKDATVNCWFQWMQGWYVWGFQVSEAPWMGTWLEKEYCWQARGVWLCVKVLTDLRWSWWSLLLHSSISSKTFREKLILLCITLLGAKAANTYLAPFQGEKYMYKADLTVRRPEHSLKSPYYCFNLFSRISKKHTTSKRCIAKIFQNPSWKHGHSSPKEGLRSVHIYNLPPEHIAKYCKHY